MLRKVVLAVGVLLFVVGVGLADEVKGKVKEGRSPIASYGHRGRQGARIRGHQGHQDP